MATRQPSRASGVLIRRRIQSELVDLVSLLAEAGAVGLPKLWLHPRVRGDNLSGWHQSAYRLARAGLLVVRPPQGRLPVLELTPAGQTQVSDWIWPERHWQRRWDGRWFVLSYDVPEKERRYRTALSHVLKKARFGCLHKSVWISAHDIRPLVSDLNTAAALREVAVLFEAYTVLGLSGAELASQAWDFDALWNVQRHYLESAEAPASTPVPPRRLLDALRVELHRYQLAMAPDPLLPGPLYPSSYQGTDVVAAFRARIKRLCRDFVCRR